MFNKRLISARKMAGLSLEQLAKKMGGITKQALNNYEKGKREPDTKIIIALSKALNIRPEYFFRKEELRIGEFEYRKRAKLGVKDKGRIEEIVKNKISKYLEIETLLGVEKKWKNPIGKYVIKSFEDVEEVAQVLRKKWELGSNAIPNLIDTLEEYGAKIIFVDVDENFDGLATYANGTPIIILNNKIKDNARLRFTLMHEFAHLLLDLDLIDDKKEREKYCHYFAGAFLAPKEKLIKEFGSVSRRRIALSELIAIKEEYGISMQALAKRLHSLGIISDASYRRFNILVNKNKWRINEPGEYKGEIKSERFKNLVYRAIAEAIISLSKAASLLDVSVANLEKQVKLI